MGLKYTVFIVKETAENLFKRLFENEKIADLLVDDTELLKKERAWMMRPFPKFKNGEDIDDWTTPKDPDLIKYQAEEKDRWGFWWMNLPGKEGYLVGGFSHYPLSMRDPIALVAAIFKKSGIKEMIFSTYHHGSNEGDVTLITLDPVGGKNFPQKEGESEKYELYAARIDQETGYPITIWHNYVSYLNPGIVPWEYSVHYRRKEEK